MASISTSTSQFTPEKIKATLEQGNPVDLSILSREVRLSVINDFLVSEKLRPLEGLGDKAKGQIEFTGINKYAPDKFVARLDFQSEVVQANGSTFAFNHLNFIGANTSVASGAIVIPIISVEGSSQHHLILVEQFRNVIGRTTFELPRGFVDPKDTLQSKPIQTALRELNEEAGVTANTVKEVRMIGEMYENTGTSNIICNIVMVRMVLSQEQFESYSARISREDVGSAVRTKVVPISEANNFLKDQHSLAAMAMSNIATIFGAH